MIDNEQLLIALVVILPALLLWGIFLARTGGFGKGRRPSLGIPRALRPGQPDEVLEGRRLERIQWGGVASVVVLALFVPLYWLPEGSRQEAFVERFDEEALHRGGAIYGPIEPLPEGISAVDFKAAEEEQALAMGCINCHGPDGTGGFVPGGFKDPNTGKIVEYRAPPLNDVFTRWDEEVVRFTIERGRPGTPMPTWGVQYGGPMTSQMVDDVIAYIKSFPENQQPPEGVSEFCEDPSESQFMTCGEEIFQARCAVCHGPEGQGKEEEGLTVQEIVDLTDFTEEQVTLPDLQSEYPEVYDMIGTWYPGLALWKGDVRHLTEELHFTTITNGRRFAFMPPFGEAPTQGITAPLYPLTESQIEAVMTYENSL